MALIQQVGIIPVTITSAYVGEMPTNDKHPEPRFQVVAVGTTQAGDTATYYGFLTNTVVGGGKYKGKYQYEAVLANLHECGMTSDDPCDVELLIEQGGLVGASVRFKMEEDHYNGEVRYKVAFMWPDSATRADRAQFGNFWASMTGGAPPAPKPQTEPATELDADAASALLGEDDLPF